MTGVNNSSWLVTTSPHDHRSLNGSRPRLRLYPPRPIFAQAPVNWPRIPVAAGVQSAARSLHALSMLSQDLPYGTYFHLPNAPSGTPRIPRTAVSQWDLILIVDTGASMTPWYPTIDSFFSCAHEVPLFTSVKVVKLHSQGFDPGRTIFDKAALENAGLDTPGHKVIFIVTDAVGPVWRSEEVWQRIREWAQSHTLAFLNVQPQQNWTRSALHTRTLTLRSTEMCGPNPSLEQKPTDPQGTNGLLSPTAIGPRDIVVPVLELHKRWLDQWCRLQLSQQWVRHQALVLTGEPYEDPATGHLQNTQARVTNFLASASRETAELVGHLAAAPLNRHIMQLIGGRLIPAAGPGDLAEILSSGLIRVTDTKDPDDAPHDQVTLDFEPGVREALLARHGWEQCQNVAEVIEEFLSDSVQELIGLARRIEFLTPPDALVVSARNLPFVSVERVVLQALPTMTGSEALRRMGEKIDSFVSQQ